MEQKFICQRDYPVVQTKAGKVRGYQLDDTVIFKGIKYADAKRFQMPEETRPWEGTKEAFSYGYVSPLMEQDKPTGELLVPHMYWPCSEDCQYLNVWTPSIRDQKKRPVMVWIHGGGFFAGSAIEQLCYEGTNMSRYGDVVVVSLNHRLNILGFLDMSSVDERYWNSANAGMADIVAALRWIRDNIAGFGGDPGNVTLFGQSGGGAKIWHLMQIPEAEGLFHKAVIQSGVYDLHVDAADDDGKDLAEALLKELKLDKKNTDKLEKLPYEELLAAYKKVSPSFIKAGRYAGNMPHKNEYFLGDPREAGFTKWSRKIPVLIGTVMGEFSFGPVIENKKDLTREEVEALLVKKYGEESLALIPEYEKAYPDKCLADMLIVDTIFRKPTISFIEARCKDPESETYSYQFTYEFPWDEGKIAWHCSELPYVFHNAQLVPICNNGAETVKLQDTIFGVWMSFARTGAPVVEDVPWPKCEKGDEAMMLLDLECRVRHNMDHVLVENLAKLVRPFDPEEENIQH